MVINGELIHQKQRITPYIKDFIDEYNIPEYKVYIIDNPVFILLYKSENKICGLNVELYTCDYISNILEDINKCDYIFINKYNKYKLCCCYHHKHYSRMKKLESL